MSHTRPTIDEVITPGLDASTAEEILILRVIKSARTLEDFLWGVHNQLWGLEEWKRMFRKRVEKIDNIDPANPHWRIELRKRLMQNAALSVAMMRLLDEDKIYHEGIHPDNVPSNLEKYHKPL